MKREQDELEHVGIQRFDDNFEGLFSRKHVIDLLLEIGLLAEEHSQDYLFVAIGFAVALQSIILNGYFGENYGLRMGGFAQSCGIEVLVVFTTTILLIGCSANRLSGDKYNKQRFFNHRSSALSYIIRLLPIQASLCTSRLVALLTLSLFHQQTITSLEINNTKIALLAVTSLISICTSVAYIEYIITPLPTGLLISSCQTKWLYFFNVLPGLSLIIHVLLHSGAEEVTSTSSLAKVISYLVLRGAIFCPVLLMLKRTFFYRQTVQKFAEVGCSVSAAITVLEGVFHTLSGFGVVKYCSVVFVVILAAVSIWHSLMESLSAISPNSLRNVLLISNSSLLALRSGLTDEKLILKAFLSTREKSTEKALLTELKLHSNLSQPTSTHTIHTKIGRAHV